MKIFTPKWGEKFNTYFEYGLMQSLKWPKNDAATKGADSVIVPSLESLMPILLETIEECLTDNEPMLMACPDFIFSDGSIATMLEYSRPGTCVGMVHTRVNPTIIDDLGEVGLNGSQLVSKAWKHLHDSWKGADCTKEFSNCYSGGVSWRAQGDLILVQHRLPTALLVNFIPSDLDFFKDERFDAWDHRWPSTWQNRQRLIGSSDAAFMVEITEVDSHCPALGPVNMLQEDWFHGVLEHHKTNRQFVSVLRKG